MSFLLLHGFVSLFYFLCIQVDLSRMVKLASVILQGLLPLIFPTRNKRNYGTFFCSIGSFICRHFRNLFFRKAARMSMISMELLLVCFLVVLGEGKAQIG